MDDDNILRAGLQKLKIQTDWYKDSLALCSPHPPENDLSQEGQPAKEDIWTSLNLKGEKCTQVACKCNQNNHHRRSPVFRKPLLRRSKLNFMSQSIGENKHHGRILKDPTFKYPQKKVPGDLLPCGNLVFTSDTCKINSDKQGCVSACSLSQRKEDCCHQVCGSKLNCRKKKTRKMKSNSHLGKLCVGEEVVQDTQSNKQPVCDDVTINELASYFELLVHIPKKMSQMAEMMYV